MIEPLKIITLVTLDRDRDATLNRLRELAIIHLCVGHTESAEQTDANRAREQLQAAIISVRALPAASAAASSISLRELPAAPTAASLTSESAEQFAGRVEAMLAARQVRASERDQLTTVLTELAPWGDFDPGLIQRQRAAGLQVHLCVGEIPQQLPMGAVLQVIAANKATSHFVVISPEPLRIELPEIILPEKSSADLRRDVAALAAEVVRLDAELARCGSQMATLDAALDGRSDQVDFLQARDSLAQADRLLHLSGYIPARREAELRTAADTHGWALLLADPSADDQDIPTLLTMPDWLQFAMPLFEFIGIRPGYREFDITTWFTGFFAIFFAMIIGDAAYGLIFALAALFGLVQAPASQRAVFKLLLMLSVAATIWGALNGAWFGIEDRSILPLLMRGIPWFQEMRNIQWLCFLIGAIHLTIAHTWKALVTMNSLTSLAQVGWALMIWGNFFLASQLVAGYPAPKAMFWLYGLGGGLVLFFTAPSRNIVKTIVDGLMTLGNPSGGAIAAFGDLLSYIRLFAVGLSGAYVASSFNMMGGMFKGSVVGFFMGTLIIVFGHVLNMVLSSLSVLVHGIRLNTLEFSGHIGVEWGGQPFRAFARRRTAP